MVSPRHVALSGWDGLGSFCWLKTYVCRMLMRKEDSFQSDQLTLDISHLWPCRSPCEGMQQLGHFQPIGSKATNSGMCVHDLFTCARTLRAQVRDDSEVETCCQKRFDLCSQL